MSYYYTDIEELEAKRAEVNILKQEISKLTDEIIDLKKEKSDLLEKLEGKSGKRTVKKDTV